MLIEVSSYLREAKVSKWLVKSIIIKLVSMTTLRVLFNWNQNTNVPNPSSVCLMMHTLSLLSVICYLMATNQTAEKMFHTTHSEGSPEARKNKEQMWTNGGSNQKTFRNRCHWDWLMESGLFVCPAKGFRESTNGYGCDFLKTTTSQCCSMIRGKSETFAYGKVTINRIAPFFGKLGSALEINGEEMNHN